MGVARHDVSTLTLTADAADLSVDVGQLRAAAEELSTPARDHLRRELPIAEGTLDFSLALNDGALTVGASVAQALHLRIVPEETALETRVEQASIAATLDGGRIDVTADFGGATVTENGPSIFNANKNSVASLVLAGFQADLCVDLAAATLDGSFLPSVPQLAVIQQDGRDVVTYEASADGGGALGGRLSVLDAAAQQLRFIALSGFSFATATTGLVLDGHPVQDGRRELSLSDAAHPALLFDRTHGAKLEEGRLTLDRGDGAPLSVVPGECGALDLVLGGEWMTRVQGCLAE